MAQMKNAFTERDYQCGENTGAHGNKYEQDLAFVIFVRCSLAACSFKLAREMIDAGKFDDVCLFVDHLKEAWLFQAKHSTNSKDRIPRRDLFPDDKRFEGNDFDLLKYVKSYFCVEQNLKTDCVKKHYFIFNNKSLEENDELKEWVDIFSRRVDALVDFTKFGASYKGFKPKEEKISIIRDKVNKDFVALKDAIIKLFESGKVEQILIEYKTPLINILEVANNCLRFSDNFSNKDGDASQIELYNQLEADSQQKSISKDSIKAIKDLLKGRSRNVQLPPFVDSKFVTEFFDRLTFCINQPTDVRIIIDDDLRLWLKSLIRPDDLGKFGESQMMLPRVKFDEVFKSWNEPNMSKEDKKSKGKSFLSCEKGEKCVSDIVKELKQFESKHSKAVDLYYVNRLLKVHESRTYNKKPFSDGSFVKQLDKNFENNKCSILIAEAGMGKTTLLQYVGFEVQNLHKRDVYLIYLKNLDKNLVTVDSDVQSMVFQLFENVLSKTTLQHLKHNLESNENRVTFLFDGYDEIAASQVKNIITLFKKLLEIQIVQLIISGRKHVQGELEHELNPIVLDLLPLQNEELKMFMRLFWNIPIDHANLDGKKKYKKFEIFSTHLLEKFHSDVGRDNYKIVGLPLMIRMLVEIFSDSFNSFLGSESDDTRELFPTEKFSLLKLYEKFIEVTFNMKIKKKFSQEAYLTMETFEDDDEMELLFDQCILEHQLIAIEQLSVEELKNPTVQEKYAQKNERFLKRIKAGKEKSLLINLTSEENPVELVHLSYAEYFVAKYLFDNVNDCPTILYRILKKTDIIQRFFFLMIEENFAASLTQFDIVDKICKMHYIVAFWACEASCVNILKKILENRVFRLKVHVAYGSLLHVAVKIGCNELVLYLLDDHGINVDIYYQYEGTPLHSASLKGNLEIVKMLLDHSANVNACDMNGQTPLHMVVEIGKFEFAKLLIDHSADVNARNNNGQTPLHMAVEIGHLGIAKLLTDQSSDVNALDKYGKTPLHLAGENGNLVLVVMLIDQLPNVKAQIKKESLSFDLADGSKSIFKALIDRFSIEGVSDKVGKQLLHLAIKNNHLEDAFILIDHSNNVEMQDKNGQTALHLAIKYGHLKIATMLIDRATNVEIRDNNGQTALHLATEYGHLIIARMLIDRLAIVNVQNKSGYTSLHLAAEFGHLEITRILINHSLNVNVHARSGVTPLHLVAKSGSLEIAKILIDQSADVNARDNNDGTPLHLAIEYGRLDIAELLIERSAAVNARDNRDTTPLHIAASKSNLEMAKILVAQSANVEAKNNASKTPIHLAADGHNLHLVLILISQLPKVKAHDNNHQISTGLVDETLSIFKRLENMFRIEGVQDEVGESLLHLAIKNGYPKIATMLINQSSIIDVTDMHGQTPLHLATNQGYLEVVRMLIDRSANIEAQDENESTPLHLAVDRGYLEIARMLIARSANINAQDYYSRTPLHRAIGALHQTIARMLIEHSANINLVDFDRRTPLHIAVEYGLLEIVEMLINESANVEAKTKYDETPLHRAAANGHLEIVMMLIDRSADIAAQDEDGNTPLHLAAINDHFVVATVLIQHSTDVNAINNRNRTSLHLAAEKGHLEMVEMLIDETANINAKDESDKTPLNLATEKGHLEIVRILSDRLTRIEAQYNYTEVIFYTVLFVGFCFARFIVR